MYPTAQPTFIVSNVTTDDYTFQEGIVWSRGNTIIMFALSFSSILLPLSAIISILLFRRERNKSSMRILLYKFAADVLTSCGSTVGMPDSLSRACWFEGIVTNIFTLASILWTGVIMLLLYSVLAYKKPLGDHWAFHVLCWGFPVIATIIPFSTSTYGAPGGLGWCWVVSKDDNPPAWEPQLWYWLSFYLYIWATMIFILVVSLRIIFHLKSPDMKENTRIQFFKVFYKLLGYPVIIFICWLPSTVSDYIQNANPNAVLPAAYLTAANSLNCMMGVLCGLYFWLVNPNMVENWKHLYSVRFSLVEYDAKFNSTSGDKGSSKKSIAASEYRSRASISRLDNFIGGVHRRSIDISSALGVMHRRSVDFSNQLGASMHRRSIDSTMIGAAKIGEMVYDVEDDQHNHLSTIDVPPTGLMTPEIVATTTTPKVVSNEEETLTKSVKQPENNNENEPTVMTNMQQYESLLRNKPAAPSGLLPPLKQAPVLAT